MFDKMTTLKLTAAIAINGAILRAGSIIEVIEKDAQALLERGKAVLATIEDEFKPEAAETAPVVSAGDEAPETAPGNVDADADAEVSTETEKNQKR
jgi:hypothetical protein